MTATCEVRDSHDPTADQTSIVQGPQWRFTVLGEGLLRYEWAEDGVFEDRASTFAVNRKLLTPEYRVAECEQSLDIITSVFHLSYDKKKFSTNGLSASMPGKVTLWGSYWRYGLDPANTLGGNPNLGGTARTLDTVDGRCNMGHGIISREGFAALDDSQSMVFEKNGSLSPRRNGDRIDGYLFCYGQDYRRAMAYFYALSGRQPLVPRYSLGCWFSRYYEYSAAEYLSLMDRFHTEEIPLSVAVIDMDWHLVKGESVPHGGWTGYTWNRELFPDPTKFADELHHRGLRMTLNDHPHEGIHCHEDIYPRMAAALGHDTKHNAPIMFDPTDPHFFKAYFDILHRDLEEKGCDFWWIDWQQGPYSKVPGLDPMWLLNHFHYLDHKRTTKDPQPLIFSRYAGPGSHRYPIGFSGDTVVTWESLCFQPEFTATASNIGYGWWSHDIGGHMQGYRDAELSARWVQLGAFSPILRVHSSDSRWSGKEPWNFRPGPREAMREAMQLRHRLVPYLYSQNVSNSLFDSQPLVRPMYWSHPRCEEAYRFPNQYEFGEALIVCPVVEPVEPKTNLAKVTAWLPPTTRRVVDLFSGKVYSAGREINLYRPLASLPVLAAEGAIVPFDQNRVPQNGCRNPDSLEVLVVVGADGSFDLWEDVRDDSTATSQSLTERKGSSELEVFDHRRVKIEYHQASGQLTTKGNGQSWSFRFLALNKHPKDIRVFVNDSQCQQASIRVESAADITSRSMTTVKDCLVVEIGGALDYNDDVRVELGSNPQLGVVSPKKDVEALLLDFEMDYGVKDQIWKVVTSEKSTLSSKVAQLLSLDVGMALLGPLVELLSADERCL